MSFDSKTLKLGFSTLNNASVPRILGNEFSKSRGLSTQMKIKTENFFVRSYASYFSINTKKSKIPEEFLDLNLHFGTLLFLFILKKDMLLCIFDFSIN